MTSRAANASQRGVPRILGQLERSIEAGNFYEAHQLYRTLFFRYSSQRRYEECADLMYNGSIKLVANSQECSAADLGLLTIEVLEKCVKLDLEDWWDRLSFLIECLGPNVVERETIIVSALLSVSLEFPSFHSISFFHFFFNIVVTEKRSSIAISS